MLLTGLQVSFGVRCLRASSCPCTYVHVCFWVILSQVWIRVTTVASRWHQDLNARRAAACPPHAFRGVSVRASRPSGLPGPEPRPSVQSSEAPQQSQFTGNGHAQGARWARGFRGTEGLPRGRDQPAGKGRKVVWEQAPGLVREGGCRDVAS